ncbi:MAG: hypothetical protein LBL75_02440 [Rickettsiales bacterium]|jgi:hypothetical protein|nr:hypothetical protein [Rickettsiales bacterium]
MNTYYRERAIQNQTNTDFGVTTANLETKTLKDWFIHQMRDSFSILGQTHSVNGKKQIISTEYANLFADNMQPNAELTSWMTLFAQYMVLQKQATDYLPGLATPNINDLMQQITNQSSPATERFLYWFDFPIDFLRQPGIAKYIQNIKRDIKDTIHTFTSNNIKYPDVKLGYREYFFVPNFTEIYCTTNNKQSIKLSDTLICIADKTKKIPTRYYSLMMCQKLPETIFIKSNNGK